MPNDTLQTIQIQNQYETEIQKVKDNFAKLYEKRCIHLMQSLKTARITEVHCYILDYFLHGDNVPVTHKDGSQEEKEIMQLANFLRDYSIQTHKGYLIGWEYWKPVKLSKKDISIIMEIIDICKILRTEKITMCAKLTPPTKNNATTKRK